MGSAGFFFFPCPHGRLGRIPQKALKEGRPVVGLTVTADINKHVRQGFTFFEASSELGMMAAGAKPLLEVLGEKCPDPKTRPMY